MNENISVYGGTGGSGRAVGASIDTSTDYLFLQIGAVITSASFLAETSASSPRKLFVFIIPEKKIWIKVSK